MDYGTGFYTTWAYDARGRMTQESKTLDSSNLFTAQWEYNSADLVKLMKYPSNNLGGIDPPGRLHLPPAEAAQHGRQLHHLRQEHHLRRRRAGGYPLIGR